MINRRSGECATCGVRVAAGGGEAVKVDGVWQVRCTAHAVGATVVERDRVVVGAGARVGVDPPADGGSDDRPARYGAAPAPARAVRRYTLLSGHEASPAQAAVFDHFRSGFGSRLVVAVAGSGKTTTMKNAVRFLPDSLSVQMLAFNVKAADQLSAAIDELREAARREGTGKTYQKVRAGTFHSVAFRYVADRLKSLGVPAREPDASKLRKILRARFGSDPRTADYLKEYGGFAAKLVALAKGEGFGTSIAPNVVDDGPWVALVEHHALSLDTLDATVEEGVALAKRLLRWSNEEAERGWIDYDDMLYLVVLWRLTVFPNAVLVVDECFVPNTPILIGLNGESKTIEELYENGFNTPIVTWSEEKGTHLSRITGVKRVPVGNPMVRIRTRRIGHSKKGSRLSPSTEGMRYGIRTIVCTQDHKIWTAGGWVAAGDLIPGTIVKHETVAPIDHSYQNRYAHTPEGRKVLSEKGDISHFGYRRFKISTFTNRNGGNGNGLSRAERILLERLGKNWIANYIVRTGVKRRNYVSGTPTGRVGARPGTTFSLGLPTHFKIDLANPDRMIAVEVDGKSHQWAERREQDARKDAWLRSRGWTVVRITNEEVRSLNDEQLRDRISACPVAAEVVSIESWTNRKHEYVYDLNVEETHCYFAHGLLVHNCQDVNPIRLALMKMLLRDGGRLYAVGDPNQSIYGFTGAMPDAMDRIARAFRATSLPLSVSYRCAASVVERARTWVDSIEPAPNAPEGRVLDDVPLADALDLLGPDDAVLCRMTRPLVSLAYALIVRGRACRVLGREIGDGLVDLVEAQKAKGIDRLVERLAEYEARERAGFLARGEEAKADAVSDKVGCVLAIVDSLGRDEYTVPGLVRRIEAIFVADGEREGVLTLATAHKAKGLEWSKVAILLPETMPLESAAKQDWMWSQELNLCYVAATRAKDTLIYVADGDERVDPKGR
jgi:UvrD/REP helicase N-terminal domain/Protein of unknown function (DUF559)/UvrD-like helicase C-terminal domain/AAA domain